MSATPLLHTQFRQAIVDRVEHGDADERALAEVLLNIYDRSCESPPVVAYVNEWCLGRLP